jgi:RPEL repeat
MRADSLEQKIQRRPTAEQLVKEGILEEGEEPAK